MTGPEPGPRAFPLLRGWRESPLWLGPVWVCLSFPVSSHWPHRWPLVSEGRGPETPARTLTASQPAEHGDDLRSPSGGREERVQVRESSPSGRSGPRKRPTRRAASGEKMGKQSLRVAVLGRPRATRERVRHE